jgi:DNA-binding MarR family transcriptional regulator
MATDSGLRKFARQAMGVDRILQECGISGNPGKVIYVLTAANKLVGVSQGKIAAGSSIKKDVVSKLVGSLVEADLLMQQRELSNPRTKTLTTTGAGKKLLSRLRDALAPTPAVVGEVKQGPTLFDEDD